MIFFYRIFINSIFILSPLIIFFRLLKKKEDIKRFKEKIGFFKQKKNKRKLIWFHGASVGELQSIVPLLEKYEKSEKISQILITSNTLSSSKIIEKIKSKKIIHQFFPIDNYLLVEKFLNHWNPSMALFIDSEIWPNMLINLAKRKIPIILLNARITKKSFKRWCIIKDFAQRVFQYLSFTYPCNEETLNYLKFFGVNNIKLIGNLKFSQKKIRNDKIPLQLKNFFNRRTHWCASSTHRGEEEFCIDAHCNLKKKYKNLVSIIIPRHVDRRNEIIDIAKSKNLKFFCHGSGEMIPSDTEIYIVDTYGETETFYNFSKIVFMGGSIIKHGGQNPLEAARYGCKIIHGPNIENFKDIYKLLDKNNIAKKIRLKKNLISEIKKFLKIKKTSNLIVRKIEDIGIKILKSTSEEIKKIIK